MSGNNGDETLGGACILLVMVIGICLIVWWRTNCSWERYLVEEEIGSYSVIDSKGSTRFSLSYGKSHDDKATSKLSD